MDDDIGRSGLGFFEAQRYSPIGWQVYIFIAECAIYPPLQDFFQSPK